MPNFPGTNIPMLSASGGVPYPTVVDINDTLTPITSRLGLGGSAGFGTTWFVDATTGSDTNDGKTRATAFATFLKATTTAGNGDIIVECSPSINGYGNAVYAENVTDQGKDLTFLTTKPWFGTLIIPPTGVPMTLTGCSTVIGYFLAATGGQIQPALVMGSQANNENGNTVLNCYLESGDNSGNTGAIKITGFIARIEGCLFDEGGIDIGVTGQTDYVLIRDCRFLTASGGSIKGRSWLTLIDRCHFMNPQVNYITLTDPGTGSMIRDCAFATPITPTSVAISGTGPVTISNCSPAAEAGSQILFQKNVTSSAILSASATTEITCAGGVEIDDIIFETDATGTAGGTNIQLSTDNAKGLALLAAETVANLGANKTVDLSAASVTALRKFVLESGKHLLLQSTVAPCTGAGILTMTVIGRRLTAYASLS